MSMLTNTHTHTHTHTHSHTHIYIYIYKHTHTHRHMKINVHINNAFLNMTLITMPFTQKKVTITKHNNLSIYFFFFKYMNVNNSRLQYLSCIHRHDTPTNAYIPMCIITLYYHITLSLIIVNLDVCIEFCGSFKTTNVKKGRGEGMFERERKRKREREKKKGE